MLLYHLQDDGNSARYSEPIRACKENKINVKLNINHKRIL